MAINRGIAPPDASTAVGQMRAALSDTEYLPLIPDEPGYGEYQNFSDFELEAKIAQAGGSTTRAIGFAYLTLAGAAAADAIEWASDDQRVNLAKRAAQLTAVANSWFDRADSEDAMGGVDFFAVEYPFGNPYDTPLYYETSFERMIDDQW